MQKQSFGVLESGQRYFENDSIENLVITVVLC